MAESTEMTKLLGVREVARWLQVSEAWVRAHANGSRQPALPSIKIGGALRFRREAVEAFIERHTRAA